MKKYQYGILSTSSIVPRFIGALRESKTGEALALASRSAEKAAEKAEEWKIPRSYGSYEELLADPDIEVVYVAMVNSEHYRYARKTLEAGKHVICEKPLALKKEHAQHLFQLAEERKLFLAEAQKEVFLPVIQEVKALIREGSLGDIRLVDVTNSYVVPDDSWLRKKEFGGGVLAGSGSYPLHLAKYLFDEEVTAYSGVCTKGSSGVDEQCMISLSLGNRILLASKLSMNGKAIDSALIFGEKGYIEIPEYWKARRAVVHYHTGEEAILEHPCRYELIYEIRHFHECMEKGLLQSPVMSREMTVSTLEILETIRGSWGIDCGQSLGSLPARIKGEQNNGKDRDF